MKGKITLKLMKLYDLMNFFVFALLFAALNSICFPWFDIMVHNPVSENWGKRSSLVIGLSFDGGKTWTKQVVLENQDGDFSYPSIIAVEDVFYITYTYNREQIRFVKLEI